MLKRLAPDSAFGPAPAERLGCYQLLHVIGGNAAAELLLATDVRTGRHVTIERLRPELAADPVRARRFLEQGRLGQRLRHPNLLETVAADCIGATCFLALERPRGTTVAELEQAARAAGGLPLGVIVRVIVDCARGLHHVHLACDERGRPLGLVHGRLGPESLLVGASGVSKIIDLPLGEIDVGFAGGGPSARPVASAYLAPEQVRGERLDHRGDVFALGAILYQLLTQAPLFRAESDTATRARILHLDVPPPETLRAGLPAAIGAVVMRALQRAAERPVGAGARRLARGGSGG